MLSNDNLAIAAHLHVLLRRKTGRVTDTEWMASNAEYAREIVRFAKAKALEAGNGELSGWAEKLEEAMQLDAPKPPLAQRQILPIVSRDKRLHLLSSVPPQDKQSARPVPNDREAFQESGFIESTFGSLFGDSESQRLRKLRDASEPRYMKGLR